MNFDERLRLIVEKHESIINRANAIDASWTNGIFERYRWPVITAEHIPLYWRYDLDKKRNPFLMERLGVNATFNPGAIELDGSIHLIVRVEGNDRKSFFARASSTSGVDGFRFHERPITMPPLGADETNHYDMRVVKHEDGWIYGLFCVERKDPAAPPGDYSSAIAQCGIARTKDLVTWERLPDLKSQAAQQRNVTLHPEFINGKYALYTRPQDSFIEAGAGGGGIGWALAESMEHAEIGTESIIDARAYHTIKELKNGIGPSPIRTPKGWLHIAHGVRPTAAGLRYVLYAFLCDLSEPWRQIACPGGYLMAPEGEERVGDVSNVLFCNGVVARADGTVFIYYASSDTRTHVATTSIERLLDYVLNTPADGQTSCACVAQRNELIDRNVKVLSLSGGAALQKARL